jgi:hypothetical protein
VQQIEIESWNNSMANPRLGQDLKIVNFQSPSIEELDQNPTKITKLVKEDWTMNVNGKE